MTNNSNETAERTPAPSRGPAPSTLPSGVPPGLPLAVATYDAAQARWNAAAALSPSDPERPLAAAALRTAKVGLEEAGLVAAILAGLAPRWRTGTMVEEILTAAAGCFDRRQRQARPRRSLGDWGTYKAMLAANGCRRWEGSNFPTEYLLVGRWVETPRYARGRHAGARWALRLRDYWARRDGASRRERAFRRLTRGAAIEYLAKGRAGAPYAIGVHTPTDGRALVRWADKYGLVARPLPEGVPMWPWSRRGVAASFQPRTIVVITRPGVVFQWPGMAVPDRTPDGGREGTAVLGVLLNTLGGDNDPASPAGTNPSAAAGETAQLSASSGDAKANEGRVHA